MMKPILPLVIGTALVSIATNAQADNTPAQNPPAQPSQPAVDKSKPIKLKLLPVYRPGDRPKAPSSVTVTCTYSSDGYLHFDQFQASSLIVTLTGLTSGFTTEQATTPDQPIYIGTLVEDIAITCLTSDNQTFQGTIYLTDI